MFTTSLDRPSSTACSAAIFSIGRFASSPDLKGSVPKASVWPSNDWRGFGDVHAQKAVVRAIENGYSLVRPDTHGLSLAVDYQGHVLGSADFFATDQQTVVAFVPTIGTRTVYAAIGDVFAWLCVAALAG